MQQRVLGSTETEGQPFKLLGGVAAVFVSGHSSGTVQLQIKDPDGNWVDDEPSWNSDGIIYFYSNSVFEYRVVASVAGSEAWVTDADRVPGVV